MRGSRSPAGSSTKREMGCMGEIERGEGDRFWMDARRRMDGLPAGRGLNIAHEAVDRHANGWGGDRVALRFLRRDGTVETMTYRTLAAQSSRFAHALDGLGLRPGSTVFLLSGRIPELYVAALGALKARLVVCPLFSAFGPEPIRARMELGEAAALVTTSSLYRRKVASWSAEVPSLRAVILAGSEAAVTGAEGVWSMEALLQGRPETYEIGRTLPEDPALLHFTSGTTGTPKGALHVHEAVIAHHATGRTALGLQPDDVFWCTADPGWVTGTSYGIISPLTHGVTSVVDEREFDAERWYRTLEEQGVTVWYTAPTALRMLMKAGDDVPQRFNLSRLRFIASVGEPLNPEVVHWGRRVLDRWIHDNWWQTETGGIMIANRPGMDVRPGSMGRPLPGVTAALGERSADGVRVLDEGEGEGELILRKGWPSLFRAYLNQEDRYRACFSGEWYLSGDRVRRDADGYYWFIGRADDVIKSSGHLIGPFEVENALVEHPAVAEAAVIGKPDPVAGEVVKAFVSVRAGYEPGEDLRRELVGHARTRLGAVVAPKEIEFMDELPRTRSGKILRRLLRARELGLAEGDLSTLENAP